MPAACVGTHAALAGGTLNAEAQKLYQQALTVARQLYKEEPASDAPALSGLIESIIASLDTAGPDLLTYALCGYDPSDVLCRNAVNVCVLALYIAKAGGYDTARLKELGMAALLHDLGEVGYLNALIKKGKLSRDEMKRLRAHPEEGAERVKRILTRAPQSVADAVLQEHERLDASGYPRGLKGAQVGDYARVIAIVDVYEALVHDRPHRQRFTPLDAVKLMLAERERYDRGLLKLLLDHIGIYPCGFLVRLSTKETAVVVKNNPLCPLRPVVRVIYGVGGEPVEAQKIIDLHETTIISINHICAETIKIS